MAVRREQVIADLQDNVTPGLARMAVAAGVADRALKSMGGTSVATGKDLDRTALGADKVGTSTRRSGPDLDKYTGRLRTLGDVAVTLGPALIPLGASTIPVLSAALSGLGSAAGAIGITIMAFKGLGDGIKALNDFQLEPTAENLQALRLEMQKLGPDGAHLVRFLDDLSPAMKDLQNVSRAGIFPGVEDGITDLMTRLPEVRKIVNRLSIEMGELAAESGSALAGDDFDAFFKFMKTDARPTLEAFAHSAGNVALGVANMLVAFAPLSRDFTGGLEGATKAFADWSAGLDDNESFQEFLAYVQESGPKVIDFLGALISALAGLVQAAAPLGTVTLEALTGIAKVFGLIASSPIGPGLYTAAAAMIAFSRATSIAEKTSARFTKSWAGMSRASMASGGIGGLALLAASLTDVDEKAHLANTTLGASVGLMVGGPWGLAIGAAAGQVLDLKDAYEDTAAAIEAANDAMRTNDVDAMTQSVKELQDQLDREHPEEGTLGNYMDAVIGSFHDFTGQTGQIEGAISELNGSLKQGGDIADLFGETIGMTGDQLRTAAGDAQAFSGALAELNGWFDKRAALRGYRDSIDELRKSLKDGFSREDAANLDAIGTSILQVAENIKSPKVRGDFLAGARDQLVDMAEHSGPKAAAAVQQVIDKFDDAGLTHPKIEITADDRRAKAAIKETQQDLDIMGRSITKPTIDADDNAFKQTYGSVKSAMAQADRLRAKPKVDVEAGDSLSLIDRIAQGINGLHDKSITVSVSQVGRLPKQYASGGYTGPGGKYEPAGIVHRGEVVIPQHLVRRDMGMLRRRYGHLPGFADGGMAGNTYTKRQGDSGNVWHEVASAAHDAATGLKGLNKQLKAQQKAYDSAKSARDDAISRRDSISGNIQQGLMGDSIWSASSGSVWAAGAHGANNPQSAIAALNARTDRANRFIAALNTLKGKGVTGAALQEILSEGLEAAEAMAASDIGTLSTFAGAVNASNAALAAAGLAGGNAIEGENIREWRKQAAEELKELREIKQAIKAADNNNQAASADNAFHVVGGVNGAAYHGHRRGR